MMMDIVLLLCAFWTLMFLGVFVSTVLPQLCLRPFGVFIDQRYFSSFSSIGLIGGAFLGAILTPYISWEIRFIAFILLPPIFLKVSFPHFFFEKEDGN